MHCHFVAAAEHNLPFLLESWFKSFTHLCWERYGRLILVHAPSLSPRPTRVMGFVHGSRATNVVCTDDGFNILTVGGNDRCLVQWRLDLDVIDADMVSAVERSKVC